MEKAIVFMLQLLTCVQFISFLGIFASHFHLCWLLHVLLHVSSSVVFSCLETCFHLFHLHQLAYFVWFLSSSFLWSVSCILTCNFCFYFLLSFQLLRFSILWFCFCFVHTCRENPSFSSPVFFSLVVMQCDREEGYSRKGFFFALLLCMFVSCWK